VNSSLTSVGTITSGVWSGTVIPVSKGGTGLTSPGSTGQILTSLSSGSLSWTDGGIHFVGENFGGGQVFFVYDGGRHGLIIASDYASINMRWSGNSGNLIGTSPDGVLAGATNTINIVAKESTFDSNTFAAKLAADYSITQTYGGTPYFYDDWYLPSMTELRLWFAVRSSLSNPSTSYFLWSSNENASTTVKVLSTTGQEVVYAKTTVGIAVRPIRAF
jgi:hypothetical protein